MTMMMMLELRTEFGSSNSDTAWDRLMH